MSQRIIGQKLIKELTLEAFDAKVNELINFGKWQPLGNVKIVLSTTVTIYYQTWVIRD